MKNRSLYTVLSFANQAELDKYYKQQENKDTRGNCLWFIGLIVLIYVLFKFL